MMKRWIAGAAAFLLIVGCCASAGAQKTKAKPVEPLLLDMPLYYQQDYPENVVSWHGEETSVAQSGCGATCVSMVIGYFYPEEEPEPDDVMRLAGDMGFYRGDGLGRDALRLLLAEYEIIGRWRELDARAIENTLRKGKPIVVYVGPGYFTESGHYIVLRGIAENGELLVADPNSREKTEEKTYRFAEIIRQAKGDYPFMICEQKEETP